MSLAMYPMRVYWDGRHGSLRNDPYLVALDAAPELPGGLRIVEIDYAPGVVAQLREHAGPMRDMTAAEVAACDALLRTIKP